MSRQAEKLKVGIVSPYPWASPWGVNRHVAGLGAWLAGRGHEVTVIAPAEAAGPAGGAEMAGFRFCGVPGTLRVPYSSSLANLALPMDATDFLDGLLGSEEFDLLHIHEPYPPSLSFTALRLARCPTVATFHGSDERVFSYQLIRSVLERFFTRLDSRICTTQSTRRLVSGHFPGEYEVIPDGVAVPPTAAGEHEGPPEVVYAAWSEPRRGLALLIRAMRLLPADIPPFRLAIAGGEELSWRENLIIPRRLRGTVTLAGAAEAYAPGSIVCAPYATISHATAVLEAMAAGAVPVVPGQGGLRELVRESSEGLLLDHPYAYNLAASLVDLLRDPGRRQALGRAASDRARECSWEKVGPLTERAYHAAHSRRRRAPAHGAIESVRRERTIFADLHTHTCHSHDCVTTPAELLAACQEYGIEAVAVTDHNTIAGALEAAALAPGHMHVIVGEEIKTLQGEIIGLYLKEEIPRGLSAEETIKRIKAQGGLVYIPHPFDPLHLTPSYNLLARNAADIDIIEVYNPRITFTSFNEKAEKLARKYDIPAGAGSDCHVLQGVGTAMLSLKKFSGPAELLASLREANIIRSRKSPVYLHSLKLIKNGREAMGGRR